ncbi:conserved hypothetical protein [Prosthecochloris aestuarii DSM 271]|uniref:WxL domain-containing protein n=1 Tax=Prosthecochloris aestuarii (strain DSM 271 / SK 413) TaxID=290512 RepID=B4S5D4_PROA2|nr:hypothetical protein [Prosthecochloris aestuarii]ACF45531.1 conserved hypothetical protein [Prosthecochloris aestuarii DSM 271]
MITLKKKLGVLALSAAMSIPFSSSAHAAQTSGSTDIKVNLPDIIILHYISDITLNFGSDIGQSANESVASWTVAWDGATSDGSGELAVGNLDDTSNELGDISPIDVTLPNVWAIRGLSSSGTATVEITGGNLTLANSSSSIALSDFTVSGSGNTSASITADLNGLHKTTATVGDVNLKMDVSAAALSGEYDTSGTEYTITATTI